MKQLKQMKREAAEMHGAGWKRVTLWACSHSKSGPVPSVRGRSRLWCYEDPSLSTGTVGTTVHPTKNHVLNIDALAGRVV